MAVATRQPLLHKVKWEGDDMKVAIYARFGNKVEPILTEEEQRETMQRLAEETPQIEPRTEPIPSPEEHKAKGSEVITLPKKKAWLLFLAPVKLYKESEIIKTDFLKRFVEEQGYEVVGESEVSRKGKEVEETIERLLESEPPVNGADVLYIKGMKLITLDGYKKCLELYDKVTAKGIEFLSADGSLERIRDDYDFYSKMFREIDEFDLERKIEEQKDDDFIPKL